MKLVYHTFSVHKAMNVKAESLEILDEYLLSETCTKMLEWASHQLVSLLAISTWSNPIHVCLSEIVTARNYRLRFIWIMAGLLGRMTDSEFDLFLKEMEKEF